MLVGATSQGRGSSETEEALIQLIAIRKYLLELYQFERHITKTSLDTHDNGLGVGRSANMGDFNPFF